jgi:hypothetical protein
MPVDHSERSHEQRMRGAAQLEVPNATLLCGFGGAMSHHLGRPTTLRDAIPLLVTSSSTIELECFQRLAQRLRRHEAGAARLPAIRRRALPTSPREPKGG